MENNWLKQPRTWIEVFVLFNLGGLAPDADQFRIDLAPLLEKVWHAGLNALIAQSPRPLQVHWPSLRAALSADNAPRSLSEIQKVFR